MAKIDRLGWAAGLSFVSYGVRVGLRVNRPEALETISSYLPPGWKPTAREVVERLYSIIVVGNTARPGVRSFNLLYADAGRIARSLNPDEVMERFEDDCKLFVAGGGAGGGPVFPGGGGVGGGGGGVCGGGVSGQNTPPAWACRCSGGSLTDAT